MTDKWYNSIAHAIGYVCRLATSSSFGMAAFYIFPQQDFLIQGDGIWMLSYT